MTTEIITYRHTSDMGEISGFGGGYENVCQSMLEAGVKWLTERMKADKQTNLQMHGYKNVYGILVADSDDAKALEDVVVRAAGGDCTGAMHQAVMSRLGYIAKNGWDAYCAELRKHEAEEAQTSQPDTK
jgi:hypothetical protein